MLPLECIPPPPQSVTAGLGTSSLTEARQDGPVRKTGSIGRQHIQGQPLFQLLGDRHEDQGAHLLHMCMRHRSSPCSLFGWWFKSLGDPKGPG